MNGMQFMYRRSSFRYSLLLACTWFTVFSVTNQQAILGSDSSVTGYLSNVSNGRWDYEVPDSTSLFQLSDFNQLHFISGTQLAAISFYCKNPGNCTFLQPSLNQCGAQSGWFDCSYFVNVSFYDKVTKNVYYSSKLRFYPSTITDSEGQTLTSAVSVDEFGWNTWVYDIGSPSFNISLCKSSLCWFQDDFVYENSAFLSNFPATSTFSKRSIESNHSCSANYISSVLTCSNGTYPAISLALIPINVTGTSFSLANYFAICDESLCFSIQGYPNLAASSVTNQLPVSTTITMAVLLPISFLLMCAFFVILYKLCCESWRKM